jgi:coenzyme F420-reducing hydrogenase alpha subunit
MNPSDPAPKKRRRITVNYMARVEGEGGLDIRFRQGKVSEVKLNIFEPPRFYEGFLRGRAQEEAPDITARICGICPVAYQMSSTHAIESILGVQLPPALRDLRRLLYCGEWIESHVLHIFMLHAPDFLGYPDAIRMAKDHPEVVKNALRLKKIGNEIVNLLGGREIHPINVRVGGFYHTPSREEFEPLREHLEEALQIATQGVEICAGFDFPDFEQDYEFIALRHPSEYPFNEGRVVSNKGLDIAPADFLHAVQEEHVPHSTSLQARLRDRGHYFVGPMARYALNFDRLSPHAQQAARDAGLSKVCTNPFKSILVRCVETLWAVEEAIRILDAYRPPAEPAITYEPKAGTGHGCTEAPRGILYHRYTVDDAGIIQDAVIVPPTSQNQGIIEEDLYHFAEQYKNLPDEDLKWKCEQAVRNYDPCISCSCHFLTLRIDRDGARTEP